MPLVSETRVLVITPAYNESGSVGRIIRQLRQRYPAFALLVINDCSDDRTAQEAEAAGARVISLPFNMGIGGAVQTGFLYAARHHFDIALQFDADGQHEVEYVSKLIEPVRSGTTAMCIGSRFLDPKGQGFRSSWLRRVGIRFFAFLISVLTGQKTTDPTSGFRAVDAKLIALFSRHYPVDFPEPESIVIARRAGARITEVPVVMHSRQAGTSSIRFLKSGYYMLKVTLAILLCVLRKRRPL